MKETINLENNKIIKKILQKINDKNIDIFELSDKIYLKPEEFINIINNPIMNISTYFEILDVIEKM